MKVKAHCQGKNCCCCEKVSMLIRDNKILKRKIDQLTMLTKKLSDHFLSDEQKLVEVEDLELPIKTEDQLEAFENNLVNDDFREKFIKYVTAIKGCQPLTKFFRRIISAEVAKEFNLEGKKSKKRFKNFQNFIDSLFVALRPEYVGQLEFEEALRKALRDAKQKYNKDHWMHRKKNCLSENIIIKEEIF